MQAVHSLAVEGAVADLARDDPEGFAALACMLYDMRGGMHEQSYLDAVVQSPSPGYTLEDAYAFLRFHEDMISGDLGAVAIDVSRGAHGDRLAGENNAVLAGLPRPFRAEFFGGADDDDGYFEWTEPILVERIKVDLASPTMARHSVVVRPRSVPLEVGYTQGSRSLLHIRQDRGLARWPYGRSQVMLFIRLTAAEIASGVPA